MSCQICWLAFNKAIRRQYGCALRHAPAGVKVEIVLASTASTVRLSSTSLIA